MEAETRHTPLDHTVVEHRVRHLVSVLLWPTVIAGIFEIAALANENRDLLLWIANAVLVIFVAAVMWREKERWETAAVAGAICGFVSTLMLALFHFATNPQVVLAFRIVTQPATSAVAAGIATGFLLLLARLLLPMVSKDLPVPEKGGDMNG